ncbi:MAG TPA: hypothetical protein ENJ80_01075 [Gammaproteobacteria bacterium]|nr:hypothetical protein [Gammaproteobacteria bacterium]
MIWTTLERLAIPGLALLLSACGGSSETTPIPSAPVIANPPATCGIGNTLAEKLVGVWKRACYESGGSWETDIYVFRNDGSHTSIVTYYNGPNCTGDALPVTNEGTYVLGNEITTTSGITATELDIEIVPLAGGGTNTAYDIVYIDDTSTLYMADYPAFAADFRPTTLDFTKPLRCQ